jgi:hypothetical protein
MHPWISNTVKQLTFKKGYLQTGYFAAVRSKQYVMVGKLHAKTHSIKETGTGSTRGLRTYPEE